jgi:predicted PurR-regulated permease PerM
MIWAMTQFGWRIRTATCLAALLGFLAEWLQRYLEFRTPEIGTVIMVLVLAFLIKLCRRVEA